MPFGYDVCVGGLCVGGLCVGCDGCRLLCDVHACAYICLCVCVYAQHTPHNVNLMHNTPHVHPHSFCTAHTSSPLISQESPHSFPAPHTHTSSPLFSQESEEEARRQREAEEADFEEQLRRALEESQATAAGPPRAAAPGYAVGYADEDEEELLRRVLEESAREEEARTRAFADEEQLLIAKIMRVCGCRCGWGCMCLCRVCVCAI